jgi:hypothetical protein
MRMESMVGSWEGAGFDYIGFGGMEGRSSAIADLGGVLLIGRQSTC